MPCMPTWESCEPLIDTIKQSLNRIWANKFMLIDEYNRRVESGALATRRWFNDDRVFQKQNPDHPLAGGHRFARIEAADAIRDASRQINRPLQESILADLHKALFDCCAAVRLSLAQALFFVGGPQSIPTIERLIQIESESRMVKGAARVALERCRMRDPARVWTDGKVAMVVTDNMDLVLKLMEIARRYPFRLLIPDPPFRELTTVRSEVQIIDRWYMGKDVWDMYCEHLDGVLADGVHRDLAATYEAPQTAGSVQSPNSVQSVNPAKSAGAILGSDPARSSGAAHGSDPARSSGAVQGSDPAQGTASLRRPFPLQGPSPLQSRPSLESQASLLAGLPQDDTPLIIIDYHMERSMSEFRNPNKPKNSVFYVEGGTIDVVALIVKKAMQGVKPIDFADVIREVNEARLAGR